MLQQILVGHVRTKFNVFVVEDCTRGKATVARLNDLPGGRVIAAHQQHRRGDQLRMAVWIWIVQVYVAPWNAKPPPSTWVIFPLMLS